MGDLKIQDVVCSRCERDYGQDVIEALTINNHGHCQLCRAELSGKFATGREQQPFFKAQLPMPPSVNHYWSKSVKRAKGKSYVHVRLSDRAIVFRNKVVGCVAAIAQRQGSIRQHSGRIKAVVTLHGATKGSFDIDNYGKGLFDALTYSKVYKDDKQIDELIVKRGEVIKGGQVDIELYAI